MINACRITESKIKKWLDNYGLDYAYDADTFRYAPTREWSSRITPGIIDYFRLENIDPDCRKLIDGIVKKFADGYRDTIDRDSDVC